MTSRSTSRMKLLRTKRRKCRLRRLGVEILSNGLTRDHQIVRPWRRQTALQTRRVA